VPDRPRRTNRAGPTALAERERLDRIEAQVAARIAALKREAKANPAAVRQQQHRRLRAARSKRDGLPGRNSG
jgi:hypothetical protein